MGVPRPQPSRRPRGALLALALAAAAAAAAAAPRAAAAPTPARECLNITGWTTLARAGLKYGSGVWGAIKGQG
jgi:hypothetical protein